MTSTFVFDEVVTFFNSRAQHNKAVEVGRRLVTSPRAELIHVGEALFEEGWKRLKERPDKRYSLTDCISFVLMEQHGMHEALTFDHHFEQAGFDTAP